MTDISWLTARPIAHRGLHDLNRTRWENTMAAFEAAIDRGYAIECDVRLAADGVPVVFHDHGLDRLTGRDGEVKHYRSTDLVQLAIGKTQQHIPLLSDILHQVRGRTPLVVELKGDNGRDDGLAAAVVEAMQGYDGPLALMSFDHDVIRSLARHAKGIPYGLTAEGTDPAKIEQHFSMLAYDLSFVSYCVADLPNPFTAFVRNKLAMPVITWTVRDDRGVATTLAHADQMTFEGFEPRRGTDV